MGSEEVRRVRAAGVETAWVESGQGEPLILLHGGEGHRGQFDVFRPLLGEGIRAISYDQRDTGDTRNGPEPYDMVRLAGDCAEFIAALGMERAHVLGASYGGMIAMQLAIHHPRSVASLVLSGTTPSHSLTEEQAGRVAGLTPAERSQFLLDLLLTPEARRDDPELITAVQRGLCTRPADAGVRRAAAAAGHDCTDRLTGISAPTLVLHGADDPVVRPRVAERMAAAIPGARLAILPRTRHGITFEARHRAAELVREFVLSHATADGR